MEEIHSQPLVTWLSNKGKILGQDYQLEDAYDYAVVLRFNELVQEAISTGELHKVYGHNEAMECCGWDGVSSRCECGNHRVAWEYEGSYKHMQIYPYVY